ncbi:hypothetical protein Pint_20696 [Pistacia integerrima]|uniref:Uncharacterized protein n=1 Tax=Pistacia integerrima TaxID=434235 RepID=A0ACC0XAN3_9ROSI|nr:hypothetical protein Pint_20696 [Pistacia integerrima]
MKYITGFRTFGRQSYYKLRKFILTIMTQYMMTKALFKEKLDCTGKKLNL